MIRARVHAVTISLLFCCLALPTTAGDEAETKLLVKCGPSTVEAVLKALVGLDVEVYDLEAMERLEVPKPRKRTPPPPLQDAVLVMDEVWRIFEEAGARREASEEPLPQLLRAHVKERHAEVRMRVSDLAAIDAIVAAFAESETLESRMSGAPQAGAARSDADRKAVVVGVELRLEPSRNGVDPETMDGAGSLHAKVEAASAEAGVEFIAASRERGTPQANTVTVSARITFAPTTKNRLAKLLRLLSDEPSLVVTEIDWQLADPEHDENAIAKWNIEVSRRVPRKR